MERNWNFIGSLKYKSGYFMKIEIMSQDQVARSLAFKDLSDPRNGIHAVNLVLDRIIERLSSVKSYPTLILERRPHITTVEENFDNLLFPADSMVRSSTHTRYLSANTVLRTNASSIIPSVIAKLRISDDLVLCPSICFRRQGVADHLHCDEPHQLDVWRIRKGDPHLEMEALTNLIETIAGCVVLSGKYKVSETEKDIATSHPYLAHVYKVRTEFRGEIVSLMEAGIVHPRFLEHMGMNPTNHSSICLGIMLDRAAMFIKNMDDIRLLRSTDERVQKQMSTLEKYSPVSKYPPIARDISFVVSDKITYNQVTDLVRQAVGNSDAPLIEEVKILSDTSYSNLPENARKRLGMVPGQKNILLRMMLRSHERTLKTLEANTISERVRLVLTAQNNP